MKFTVEYKALAYFTATVEADSEEEATKIAEKLNYDEFEQTDILCSTWEYVQTYEGE